MKKFIPVMVVLLVFSCASAGFEDPNHFILNPENLTLQAHEPKNDQPIKNCVVKLVDGSLSYECVVYFETEHRAILNEIDRLEKELITCQQKN